VVATPPSTHPELVRRLLETGVHVLCEKPLALTSREAREMLDLARRRGLVLMMASKFRYLDEIVEAKRLLEAGTLGRPLLLENAFCSKVPMKDRWNARKEVAGGGVLIDNGTHSADIARNLLGPVVEVQAHCGPSYQGLEVEDTARLLLRTRGGALGSIDLSWSLDKELDRYLAVYGTKGTLLVGWQGARYRQDGGSWVPFGRGYDKVGCLRAQFADFLAVIRGEAAPRMTAEDALASVEVIEAAYASAAEGRWVRVGEEG
jgi:predicted dehydrogenase